MQYKATIISKLTDNQKCSYQFTYYASNTENAIHLLRKFMHVHNCTDASLSVYSTITDKFLFVCSVVMPKAFDFDKIPIPDYVKQEPCSDCPRLF